MIRLPIPSVVVLVGPANAGKTSWARANFEAGQIVSSDALRAQVGESEDDQRASEDAFAVLDSIVERRLRRQLTTVIDTTGLDVDSREKYRELARASGLPCYSVAFDVPRKELETRNRARERPIPQRVLTAQIKAWQKTRKLLEQEAFADVLTPEPALLVPPDQLNAPELARRQADDPVDLRFDLLLPNFTWPGGPAELGPRLAEIARAAEQAGFRGIWVMDHFIQIPQAGREWDEMLESYTTSGFLSGQTHAARVGVLVTGITYRNPALVGKMVATLDVLSGGRAVCGLGAGWFEREHRAYGWDFPPVGERFDLLEDALQLLPLMWGPGSPSFEGKVISVPEAVCYPRPLQEKVPIVVGGSGERKTLRLVAQYADGCNLRGGPDAVKHKLAVLEKHCADVGRDAAEIEITHLSRAVVAADREAVDRKVARLKQPGRAAEKATPTLNAGTVEDHIGRFRALSEAGIRTAIVNFPDVGEVDTLGEFAPVIGAFTPN
ncbi:MAG: TIGR03560 family F420-dependent LLM class oxidoreductase [Acidimicrobiia bacterium]